MKREEYLKYFNDKRYIKFLKDLSVAEEKHLRVLKIKIEELINKFVFINNKCFYLNTKNAKLVEITKTDFKTLIDFEIGALAGFFNLDSFYTFLKIIRTFNNIVYRLDPFAKEKTIKINKEKNEVVVINNNIYLKEPEKVDLNSEEAKDILNDYKKHFENKFDYFLDFIIYTRFTSNRKKSFLNLNAKSNWGKGFLMSIFTEILEAGVAITETDLREDRAGGLTPDMLQNSLVLFIDEFKKFSNHLFKVTHSINLEPKFSFKTNVEIFAKVLLNADKSESFNYLVDEQVSNRVLLIEIKNKKRLDDRELYKKNNYKYRLIIANYIYNYFKEATNELTKKTKEEAELIANKKLQEIYKKYSITTNYNVEDIIREAIYNFLLKIRNEEDRLTNTEQKIATNIYFEQNNFYITKTIQTLMNILENELDATEYSKVKFKKGMILEILEKEQKTYRINKIPKKAIKISLDEIQEYLDKNVEIAECNNNFKTPMDFIYSLRRYLEIEDNEFEIKDNEITFYTIQKYTLKQLNEDLRLVYDCNKEEMLQQFANNIKVYSSLKEINQIYNEIPEEEKEVIEITEEELLDEL